MQVQQQNLPVLAQQTLNKLQTNLLLVHKEIADVQKLISWARWQLWFAAVKPPMYTVCIIPVLVRSPHVSLPLASVSQRKNACLCGSNHINNQTCKHRYVCIAMHLHVYPSFSLARLAVTESWTPRHAPRSAKSLSGAHCLDTLLGSHLYQVQFPVTSCRILAGGRNFGVLSDRSVCNSAFLAAHFCVYLHNCVAQPQVGT